MSCQEFLDDLASRGIILFAEGENIRFKAKKSALTAEIKSQIVSRKAELLAFLRQQQSDNKQDRAGKGIEVAPRVPRQALSFAQSRIALLQELDRSRQAYLVNLAMDLDGPLDLGALRASFDELFRRHEILRTSIHKDEHGRFQVIHEDAGFDIVHVDETGKSEEEQAGLLELRLKEFAACPFELSKAPLLRAEVIQLSDQRHRLMLGTHLIAGDGQSLQIMLAELSQLYSQAVAGSGFPRLQTPLQYADFAHWQQAQWDAGAMAKDTDFWLNLFAAPVADLRLPFDQSPEAGALSVAATAGFEIDGAEAEAIRAWAKDNQTTLFAAWLAGLTATLHASSAAEDLLFATVVSHRGQLETEKMLGSFSNNVLLRMACTAGMNPQELLALAHETGLDAFAHQELPFEKLLETNQAHNVRLPTLRILFVYHQGEPLDGFTLDNLRVSPVDVPVSSTTVDWTFIVSERPSSFELSCIYRGRLFSAPTMRAFLGRFRSALLMMPARQNDPVADLDLACHEDEAPLWRSPPTALGVGGQRGGLMEKSGKRGQLLLTLCREILRLAPDAPVSLHDNFFDIGGHSLVALELIAKIEQQFGVELDPGDVMMQTLGQIAASLPAVDS